MSTSLASNLLLESSSPISVNIATASSSFSHLPVNHTIPTDIAAMDQLDKRLPRSLWSFDPSSPPKGVVYTGIPYDEWHYQEMVQAIHGVTEQYELGNA
jgi:hypothetical protein